MLRIAQLRLIHATNAVARLPECFQTGKFPENILAVNFGEELRSITMPCSDGRPFLPVGRDPDSKWVQWLARSRQMNRNPAFDTSSSSPTSSAPFRASANISDSKPLHSCSSATSYFALLSANEDGSIESRASGYHKQHGSFSDLTKRDMDSPWVAWFTERSRQRQRVDMPDRMRQEGSRGSEQSFLDNNKVFSPSTASQLPTPKNTPSPGSHIATISAGGAGGGGNNSSYNNTTTTTTTTSRPAIPSLTETNSTWLSPLSNFLDSDIDNLDTFTDLFPDFGSTIPFDSYNDAQANESTAPYAITGLDEGEDLAWLEDPQQLAFSHNIDAESEKPKPNPSKRTRAEQDPSDYFYSYPNDAAAATHICLEEEPTNKHRKIFHSRANSNSNYALPSSPSPFSPHVLRSSLR